MNCNQLQDLYSNFFEGDLTEAEHAAFESHLSACDGCCEDYHVFAQVFRVLDATVADEVDVPNGFRAGILARISSEQVKPAPSFLDWLRSKFLVPNGALYGGAAALAACIVVIAFLVSPKPSQTVTGHSDSTTAVSGEVIGGTQPPFNITGAMFQGISDQTGSDGTNYKVFTLHTPQDVSASASVDADIVQDASALREPDGSDGPGQSPAWDGTVEPNTTVQIPVALKDAMPQGKTLNMMLRWNDGVHHEQKELVFVPVAPSAVSPSSLQIPPGTKFYDAVQAIADAYQATVSADPSALNALTVPRTFGTLTGSETDAASALKSVLAPALFIVTTNQDGSITISHS